MTLRRLLFWLHLATGLTVGLVVVFLAITGAILTFQTQIIGWSEQSSRIANPASGPCIAPSGVLKSAADFEGGVPTQLTLYSDPHRPAEVGFGGTTLVMVDSCRATVVGPAANRLRRFFQATRDLHRWVALNGVRHEMLRNIKNGGVLAFLFLLLSGLLIWFPRELRWQHLRAIIVFRAQLKARARDWNWHNVFGFWSSLPLAIICLSGIVMAYPWANALLYRAAGSAPPPERAELGARRSKPLDADKFPTLDGAIQLARAQDPQWKSLSMRLPAGKDPNVVFALDEGDGSLPQQRAQLVIARNDLHVVRWEPFASYPRGRQWRLYARFLHTGEIFGIAGRSVALFAMVGALMLVWTGFSLSLRRFQVWRKKRAARSTALSATTEPSPQRIAVGVVD